MSKLDELRALPPDTRVMVVREITYIGGAARIAGILDRGFVKEARPKVLVTDCSIVETKIEFAQKGEA